MISTVPPVRAFYNDIDSYACEWTRRLIAAGHIASGEVYEKNIASIGPEDLHGYTQAHFFSGISVWQYALRRAGWPDDRAVWTGSCPCQPFSSAGQRRGFTDPKHLWPDWFRLIRECRPSVLFGEQVSSPDGLKWLDVVSADLESEGYAIGTLDICAAGVGAPHLRQRSYFMAYTHETRRFVVGSSGLSGDNVPSQRDNAHRRSASVSVADTVSPGLPPREREELRSARGRKEGRAVEQRGSSPWADAEWLECRNGKRRPVEPGTFPLAHGSPSRVGRLRATGNAIVSEVAVTFIRAAMEILDEV